MAGQVTVTKPVLSIVKVTAESEHNQQITAVQLLTYLSENEALQFQTAGMWLLSVLLLVYAQTLISLGTTTLCWILAMKIVMTLTTVLCYLLLFVKSVKSGLEDFRVAGVGNHNTAFKSSMNWRQKESAVHSWMMVIVSIFKPVSLSWETWILDTLYSADKSNHKAAIATTRTLFWRLHNVGRNAKNLLWQTLHILSPTGPNLINNLKFIYEHFRIHRLSMRLMVPQVSPGPQQQWWVLCPYAGTGHIRRCYLWVPLGDHFEGNCSSSVLYRVWYGYN